MSHKILARPISRCTSELWDQIHVTNRRHHCPIKKIARSCHGTAIQTSCSLIRERPFHFMKVAWYFLNGRSLNQTALTQSKYIPIQMGYLEQGGYIHVLLLSTHFSPTPQSKF